MKPNPRPRLEALIVGLAILTILANVIGLFFLWRGRPSPSPAPAEPTAPAATEPTLSGPEFYRPENLALGQKLPVTRFRNGAGETVDLLTAYPGQTLVLMYWGTWCPYCEKQLESLAQLQSAAEEAGGTRLILVNKTDESKEETIQKAEQYLQKMGWDSYDHVYDVGLEAYRAYGMKRIPTTIVADEAGYVRAMETKVLTAEAFGDLLEYARIGNAGKQLTFLESSMMNPQGGIYTAYRNSAAPSPKGHDVLSESMGLLMNCAVQLDDRALFQRCWDFVSENMERQGVFAWYVAEDGTQGTANALLDDLRIARALYLAEEKWGGYAQPLETLAEGILDKNVYRGHLSSFYDFRQGKPGSSISLTYGDFTALELLAQSRSEFAALGEDLLQIVQGGFISPEFPLYYASYDYGTGTYSRDSLNTAEALLTVYHLSERGLAREETLQWLKDALQGGTLAARYRVDGTAEAGYQYDSTAVFAIAALIGQAAGDGALYHMARNAMERSYVSDVGSRFCGAFLRGGDLQAFDQLLPLTVYATGGSVTF